MSLTELAVAVLHAEERLRANALINIAGASLEERAKLRIEADLAAREWERVYRLYLEALARGDEVAPRYTMQ